VSDPISNNLHGQYIHHHHSSFQQQQQNGFSKNSKMIKPLKALYLDQQSETEMILDNFIIEEQPEISSEPYDHYHQEEQQQCTYQEESYSYKHQTQEEEKHDKYEQEEKENEEEEHSPDMILATPSRKQQDYYVSTEGLESEFVDPLETFEYLERSWHVYMTEQQHVYYLDMENSHSQWEDPRQFGIVTAENYMNLPPESPSKLSDGHLPPLSPQFRSPSAMKVSPPKISPKPSTSPVHLYEKLQEMSMNSIMEEESVDITVEESITITSGPSSNFERLESSFSSFFFLLIIFLNALFIFFSFVQIGSQRPASHHFFFLLL
jgi:hypothetical protein